MSEAVKSTTEAISIAALAVASADVRTVDETPFVVVPDGYTAHDLSAMLKAPTRARGTRALRDVVSFCRYVHLHADPAATTLYGSVQPPKFTAIFNDHARGAPGWRDFGAVYDCPLSIEWKTWTAANKRAMPQTEFAQFIEDNAPDCVVPNSATMIEISRTLEAKKKVNFASGIRLTDGANELTYEEEITGTASKGKIKIPETFTIGIPVLEGGPRYSVTARLRYRIADKGGVLSLWFDLERPHKIIEDAVREVWTQIESDTGLPIFNGG